MYMYTPVCVYTCTVYYVYLCFSLLYREVHRGDEYRDLHMHVVFNLLVSQYISLFLTYSLSSSLSILIYSPLCVFLRIFTSLSVAKRYIYVTSIVSLNFIKRAITGWRLPLLCCYMPNYYRYMYI